MKRKKRKSSYLSYYDPNIYGGGGFTGAFYDMNGAFGESLAGALPGLSTAMGGIFGNIMGGGMSSGAGNALNAVGDIAGKLPGIYGVIGGLGSKIAAGGINALVGTKTNEAQLNAANQQIGQKLNYTSNATEFDDVKDVTPMGNIQNPFKGGLFKKGWAKNAFNALKDTMAYAQDFAERSQQTNIENISNTKYGNYMRGNFAKGGSLGKLYDGEGDEPNTLDTVYGGRMKVEGQPVEFSVTAPYTQPYTYYSPWDKQWYGIGYGGAQVPVDNPGKYSLSLDDYMRLKQERAKSDDVGGWHQLGDQVQDLGWALVTAPMFEGVEGASWLKGLTQKGRDAIKWDLNLAKGASRQRYLSRAFANEFNNIVTNGYGLKNTVAPVVPIVEDATNIVSKEPAKQSLKFLEKPRKVSLKEVQGYTKAERNTPFTRSQYGYNSQMPDDFYLINRTNTPFEFDTEGKLVWQPGGSRAGAGRRTVHFTTDKSVSPHMSGNWNRVSETGLFPYRQVVSDNGLPINIEPMDTMFGMDEPFMLRRDGAKIFTGDKNNYLKYKRSGVDAYTTNKAQELHSALLAVEKEYDDFLKAHPSKWNAEDWKTFNDITERSRKLGNEYDEEQLRWIRNYSNPTAGDYKLLEQETGLPSLVQSNDEGFISYDATGFRPNVKYHSTPATHSNSWYGADVKGVNDAKSIFLQIQKRLRDLDSKGLTMSDAEKRMVKKFTNQNRDVYSDVSLDTFNNAIATAKGPEAKEFFTNLRNLYYPKENKWDALYFDAIKRGDMKEVQRLRDLHFVEKAPNNKLVTNEGYPVQLYHGSPNKFYKFDVNAPRVHDEGTFGKGIYTTGDASSAMGYGDGKNLYKLYGKIDEPFANPDVASGNFGYFNNLDDAIQHYKAEGFSEKEIKQVLKNLDTADGVVAPAKIPYDEVVFKNGNQIKLSDAITYDDAGNIIPLSQRDNFSNPDIRYSWLLPLIGTGTALGLSSQKSLGGNLFYNGGPEDTRLRNLISAMKETVNSNYNSKPLTGGSNVDWVVTPEGSTVEKLPTEQGVDDTYLFHDKQFHPVIRTTNGWQQYWGNQGAASVNNAMGRAGMTLMPYFLSLWNPVAFAASMIGGKFVDEASKEWSGGKYDDWSDFMNQNTGMNRTLAGFTNPGYLAGAPGAGELSIGSNLMPNLLRQAGRDELKFNLGIADNAARTRHLGRVLANELDNVVANGYGLKNTIAPSVSVVKDVVNKEVANQLPFVDYGMAANRLAQPFEIENLGGGYMLKSLMRGNPLEKQLSKKGYVSVNSIMAQANKGSAVDKEVINKVLSNRFAGKKSINYNDFRRAVQDELIGSYNVVPSRNWEDYGIRSLGFKDKMSSDAQSIRFNEATGEFEQIAPFEEFKPDYTLNTYTFESPRIPVGNGKHYNKSTLGHSRTYTTNDEPNVLHVMESQSDWAQNYRRNSMGSNPNFSAMQDNEAWQEYVRRFQNNLPLEGADAPITETELINAGHALGVPDIEIKKVLGKTNNNVELHLVDNYTQRQIQENLKYAAEHNQTKMRYPTSETAAKIEGYPKFKRPFKDGKMLDPKDFIDGQTTIDYDNFVYPEGIEVKETYLPEHQTILKKYSDFPKQYQKLFKGSDVRTVTDAKGNSWYEVDVPQDYLNQEWQFGLGGNLFPDGGVLQGEYDANGNLNFLYPTLDDVVINASQPYEEEPRKYVARYDQKGNPIYTTDKRLSMGYDDVQERYPFWNAIVNRTKYPTLYADYRKVPNLVWEGLSNGNYYYDAKTKDRVKSKALQYALEGAKSTNEHYYNLTGDSASSGNIIIGDLSERPFDIAGYFDPEDKGIHVRLNNKMPNINLVDFNTIKGTVAHEQAHRTEDYLANKYNLPSLQVYSPKTEYYIPNKDHPVAFNYWSGFMGAKHRHAKSPEEIYADYMNFLTRLPSSLGPHYNPMHSNWGRVNSDNFINRHEGENSLPVVPFITDYEDYLRSTFGRKNGHYALGGTLYSKGGKTHTVEKGDTLWGISKKYDIPLYDGIRWGGVLPNVTIKPDIMNDYKLEYKDGGPLASKGNIWSNGLRFINTGGTHEENPLEGVLMGIGPNGEPNKVEEGEVIWNDYVFSDRLKVPKELIKEYKLGGALSSMTFADAVKKAQKESAERPNDPISKRGLDAIMNKLMIAQEAVRQQEQELENMRNSLIQQGMAAFGGRLFDEGGPTYIADQRGDNLLGYDEEGNPIELNVVAPRRWTSALPLTWTSEYRERERKKKEKREALGRLFDYTTQMAFPELELMQSSTSSSIPKSNKGRGISKKTHDYLLKRAVLPIFEEQVGYNPEEVEESFKKDPFKATSTPVYPNDVLNYIKGFVNGDRYAIGGRLGNLYPGPGSKSNMLEFRAFDPYKADNGLYRPNPYPYDVSQSFTSMGMFTPDNQNYKPSPILTPNTLPAIKGMEYTDDKAKHDLSTNNYYTWLGSKGTSKVRPWEVALRYAPVLGSAISVVNNLLTKPNYRNADYIMDYANGISKEVEAPKVDGYMAYIPKDRQFGLNDQNLNSGKTSRYIMNTSGGNRGVAMTGELANGFNTMIANGDAFSKGEEANWGRKKDVYAHNTPISIANAENELKAASMNQDMNKTRLQAAITAAGMRAAEDDRIATARSAALTNLFDSLGYIGREAYIRQMMETNPALYYGIDRWGNVNYKAAKGGYLTVRKKRRRK